MKQFRKTVILALFGIVLFTALKFNISSIVSLPQTDQQIILYSNQADDDLKQTFSQAINEAHESILLIIYSLTDKTLISNLKQKASEGIDVTVICDPEASVGVERRLGSQVKTYKRRGQGIMHIKILVTDSNRVWLGSANMTPQSLLIHGNLVAGFYSPEMAAYLRQKSESMIHTGLKYEYTHRSFSINGQNPELWLLPDDKDAVARIKQLIRTAQKTIQVAMFTWTRIDLAQELIEAHQRGIQVEVALDRNSSNGVSSKVTKLLREEGIPVSLNEGSGLLHHKMVLIDQETLVFGSANWTLAAFEKNNDCFVVLPQLNQEQCIKLQTMWRTIILDSDAENNKSST